MIHKHPNFEVSQLLELQDMVRRLKKTKPFALWDSSINRDKRRNSLVVGQKA